MKWVDIRKCVDITYEHNVSDQQKEFHEGGFTVNIKTDYDVRFLTKDPAIPILRDSLEKIKQVSDSYEVDYFGRYKLECDFIKAWTEGSLWWQTTKCNCTYCGGKIIANVKFTYYPAKEYKSPPSNGKDLCIVLNTGYIFSADIQIYCAHCKQSSSVSADPVMMKSNAEKYRIGNKNKFRKWKSYVGTNQNNEVILFGSVSG